MNPEVNMKHTGSCHCGKVAFKVDGEIVLTWGTSKLNIASFVTLHPWTQAAQ